MKTQKITDWIVSNFRQYSNFISLLGIYGSIARGSKNPNDCDLLIVVELDVESEMWLCVRQQIISLRKDFFELFRLPLNVAFLIEEEWIENKFIFRDLLQIDLPLT